MLSPIVNWIQCQRTPFYYKVYSFVAILQIFWIELYELGYIWCLGLYPTGEETECEPHLRYSEKLRDQRWQNKRRIVIDRAKGRCEDCSSLTSSFEVHHCYYMARCQPWQYPLDSLRALCPSCHEYRAKVEVQIMGLLAHAPHPMLDDIYRKLQKQINREEIA